MLFRNAQTFFDYTILAQDDEPGRDNEIGKVNDFFFDDTTWTVRYLVVKTGNWLTDRKVLTSPQAVTQSHWEAQQFEIDLTRDQVQNSPDINADQPVSLQHQIDLHEYYGWPYYWTTPGYVPIYGPLLSEAARRKDQEEESEEEADPHLRSIREVTGYHIQATDDEIGHVEDFLIEDENWAIHYMVVDTRNWLPGKEVLISPRWIRDIDWEKRQVVVNVTQDAVKNSPEYRPEESISREYEEQLHEHYGLPKYWDVAMFIRQGSHYPI